MKPSACDLRVCPDTRNVDEGYFEAVLESKAPQSLNGQTGADLWGLQLDKLRDKGKLEEAGR
jgi:hypothetical protein